MGKRKRNAHCKIRRTIFPSRFLELSTLQIEIAFIHILHIFQDNRGLAIRCAFCLEIVELQTVHVFAVQGRSQIFVLEAKCNIVERNAFGVTNK